VNDTGRRIIGFGGINTLYLLFSMFQVLAVATAGSIEVRPPQPGRRRHVLCRLK
jgi:hypothetical protein